MPSNLSTSSQMNTSNVKNSGSNNYLRNLEQMSVSNMSSALSSIMGEINSHNNVTTVLNAVPTNIVPANVAAPINVNIPAHPTKNISPNIPTQPKTLYSNMNPHYERPESAYSNAEKKRAANNLVNNPDENMYSKKYIPTGMNGMQPLNYSGINQASSNIGHSSSKYNMMNYPSSSKMTTSHEGKYPTGASKNIHESSSTTSGLSKGSSNKYGLLNIGLNRPGGMFKASKE